MKAGLAGRRSRGAQDSDGGAVGGGGATIVVGVGEASVVVALGGAIHVPGGRRGLGAAASSSELEASLESDD